ncbi:MAG TPA: hypothetical protein PKL83_02580 [bacterium]|nr:hypothetical protein [bacterium]
MARKLTKQRSFGKKNPAPTQTQTNRDTKTPVPSFFPQSTEISKYEYIRKDIKKIAWLAAAILGSYALIYILNTAWHLF